MICTMESGQFQLVEALAEVTIFLTPKRKKKLLDFVSDHLKRLTGLKYGDLNKSYKKSLKLIKFPQN